MQICNTLATAGHRKKFFLSGNYQPNFSKLENFLVIFNSVFIITRGTLNLAREWNIVFSGTNMSKTNWLYCKSKLEKNSKFFCHSVYFLPLLNIFWELRSHVPAFFYALLKYTNAKWKIFLPLPVIEPGISLGKDKRLVSRPNEELPVRSTTRTNL